MPFGFLNLLMLAGLAAMAIPPIIHLLNRRRYDVVNWGAMQFLQVSETTRRRLLIEELLLMLLRMGLIGVLVLALASPFVKNEALGKLVRGNKDVVLVFDGSFSMGYTGTGQSAHAEAKQWAMAYVDDLAANDTVAILQAKQQVVPVVGSPTHNLEGVRKAIDEMPEPAGGTEWPQALEAAFKILEASTRADREIVLLTDNQRFGWADDNSLLNWQLREKEFKQPKGLAPRVRVVNLARQRPKDPPNWSLAPLRASQTVVPVGWEVTFRTALVLRGQDRYSPPFRIRLEIDGQAVRDLKAPETATLVKGQVPLSFTQAFASAGSHLVSVIVEPDPPPERRPAGHVIKDHLPGDNRQDFAIEIVPALPVLLVDGDDRAAVKHRGVDFLRDALAPAVDKNPVVLARVVTARDFEPALLAANLGAAGTAPRVLVLSNVAQLTQAQQEGITAFLAAGGGVLVTLGERIDVKHYNEELYRAGQGWLPAHVEDIGGDESRVDRAARPSPATFLHPALELFRDMPTEGLAEVRFPRWWKLTTPGKNASSVPVALLTSNDPFLVERSYEGGRVLVCSVPLDDSWRSNVTKLPAFVPLAHELIYYLAGARGAEHNIQPGQPLRYWPDSVAELDNLNLQLPNAEPKKLGFDVPAGPDTIAAQVQRLARGMLVEIEGTRETGVYRLLTAGRTVYYVAQPDPRESDLTPCEAEDRAKVARYVPLKYDDDPDSSAPEAERPESRREVWWWCLLGVIALLCGEVWMTRRLVKAR